MAQAEAIVTLQLYRLTNTDVVELEERLIAKLRKNYRRIKRQYLEMLKS